LLECLRTLAVEILQQALGSDGLKAVYAQPIFGTQHPFYSSVKLRLTEAAIGNIGRYLPAGSDQIFGQQQHVIAGEQRFCLHLPGLKKFGYPLHVQRIGKNEPAKIYFFAQ